MTAWYEQLRDQYRPARLEVLLIGESPPDPGAGERRFFYAPTLRIDNLHRGVAQGLYGNDPDVELTDKPRTCPQSPGPVAQPDRVRQSQMSLVGRPCRAENREWPPADVACPWRR